MDNNANAPSHTATFLETMCEWRYCVGRWISCYLIACKTVGGPLEDCATSNFTFRNESQKVVRRSFPTLSLMQRWKCRDSGMSFNSADTPRDLYALVDEQGGGILVPWMKYAKASGDYNILEEYLDTAVRSYTYNGGKGKLVSISELVMIRNKQRNAMLSALRRKKGRGKSGPNILEHINQERTDQGDFMKALKILDGGNIRGHKSFRYRETVWDITQRGKMGENLLHICLLHNTSDMNDLAKQIVNRFPKIVNDIFISEEYYGLSPLHQAIVNEDVDMVYFLVKNQADVHQRCYGSFFCADDQKTSRTDSLEHEWVDLQQNTRYTGQMYWGEYPLAFAACTKQQDCFRLLRACKADPNMQDTNGNTTLHMCVIHDLPEMFTLAFQLGGNLHVRNNLKLTPLALAAKMANKKMFDLILGFEMDVVWRYGDIVCKAYPLADIDTIAEDSSMLNPCSVLANVVYGDKSNHLEFFDGLIEELLERKWETFARKRLFHSLFGYLWFLLTFYIAFMFRDVTPPIEKAELVYDPAANFSSAFDDFVVTIKEFNFIQGNLEDMSMPEQCHLWNYHLATTHKVRLCAELLTILSIIIRTGKDLIDIQQSGYKRWWTAIKSFPEKVLHKLAQVLILLMVPVRFFCFLHPNMLVLENTMAIVTVIMTTMHFLFYCRSMQFVGPFVLMVYKIIIQDMSRFLIIYSVFILCFSQAFYIIFLSCERAEYEFLEKMNMTADTEYDGQFENIMNTPSEALMRMFIVSVGEFGAFYKNLNDCKSSIAAHGKFFFVMYELLVTIMLLNLLIAMMTRTYEKIAETEKEWKRQWAKVILMLEQCMSPAERRLAMFQYSRPIRSDKRQRAFVVRQKTAEEKIDPRRIDFTKKKLSIIRLSQNSHLHVTGMMS